MTKSELIEILIHSTAVFLGALTGLGLFYLFFLLSIVIGDFFKDLTGMFKNKV